MKGFFKERYGVELVEQAVSTAGWNWGKISFDGLLVFFFFYLLGKNNMSFFVNEEKSFDIQLSKIVKATLRPKSDELAIEFEQKDSPNYESLVEMRYYIPPRKNKPKDDGKKRAKVSSFIYRKRRVFSRQFMNKLR